METGTVLGAAQNHVKLQSFPHKVYCSYMNPSRYRCDLNVRERLIGSKERSQVSPLPDGPTTYHPGQCPGNRGTRLQLLQFLFNSPLITHNWQCRNRMRKQAKGWRSGNTCCKSQLISDKTASTAQISWVPVCCCCSWTTSVPVDSYAHACNRRCHPDLYF